MTGATVEKNPLALSDDDFMNLVEPAAAAAEVAAGPADEVIAAAAAPADVVAVVEPPVVVADPAVVVDPAITPDPAAVADPAAVVDPNAPVAVKDPKDPADPAADPAGSAEGEVKPVAAVETPVNYEESYKQIMAPFKANGKTFELKSPAEAIQLMQMGANYARKMQDLVPHRKVLTMLQNNGLLNEDKLSFFIDLDKKDPEAIKKFIKESGIDPLEIDTASEPAYLEGSHRVTDEEVSFRASLEELSSTPEGKETLQVINTNWDQASKDVLWKNPEAMALIHAQREIGIYDRIVVEMDRQVTLGTLPPGTPFIQAYKTVGDQLTEADAFADLREKHSGNAPLDPVLAPPGQVDIEKVPEPVATRAVVPKPLVSNAAEASAASLERSTPKPAQVFVNPLAMSDDEFLKTFNGRL